MSVTVSLKVKREIVELADRMIKCGIAKSKSHAFNIMIERGIESVAEEVELVENIDRDVEEMERENLTIRHGGLTKLLEEARED